MCVEFSDSCLKTSIVILAKQHLLSSKILYGRMWSLKGTEGFLTQVSQLFVHTFTSTPFFMYFLNHSRAFCLSQHQLAGIRLFVAALLSPPLCVSICLPSPLPACWPLCVTVCLSVLLIFPPIKPSSFYSYPSFYMSSNIACFQTRSLKYSATFF